MNDDHIDDQVMLAYLESGDDFPLREEVERHVAECSSCRERLEEWREFEVEVESNSLWEFAEAVRRHRDIPELVESTIEMLRVEDEDVRTFLMPVIGSPAAFKRTNVTSLSYMRTAGVVRQLYAMARELREKQPMHALSLADAAIAITEQLPTGRYRASLLADLRGNSWLERGNVLRYLGRFPEALDALDIAERAFDKTRLATWSAALVQYVRSTILIEVEQFDEALRLARSSAMTFYAADDEERYAGAKMVEAAVFFYQHNYEKALELFQALVPKAKQLGDAALLARLYSNIADCYVGVGKHSDASGYVASALSLFEAMGLETEQVRARWTLGQLLVRSGDLPRGIARLRQTKDEFERLGAKMDAKLATLDLIEGLLLAGWHAEVPELCAQMVTSFTSEGMMNNAMTALALLSEAVAARRATPTLVRYIREYLPTAAERAFVPPPPDVDKGDEPYVM
jgi:tetratricopeptide (TPR) repeat protein